MNFEHKFYTTIIITYHLEQYNLDWVVISWRKPRGGLSQSHLSSSCFLHSAGLQLATPLLVDHLSFAIRTLYEKGLNVFILTTWPIHIISINYYSFSPSIMTYSYKLYFLKCSHVVEQTYFIIHTHPEYQPIISSKYFLLKYTFSLLLLRTHVSDGIK